MVADLPELLTVRDCHFRDRILRNSGLAAAAGGPGAHSEERVARWRRRVACLVPKGWRALKSSQETSKIVSMCEVTRPAPSAINFQGGNPAAKIESDRTSLVRQASVDS